MQVAHIALVISSLRSGGAERVAATLANNFCQRSSVTIICLSEGEPAFYPLDNRIEVVYLNCLSSSDSMMGAVFDNINRVKTLRRTLAQINPDIVVAFMLETNVLATLARVGLGTSSQPMPLILCEHTDPRFIQHNIAWRCLRWLSYRFGDRLVVLNQYMKTWFEQRIKSTVIEIPNPIAIEMADEFSVTVDSPFVLSMGRLIPSKCFDELIKIYVRLCAEFENWHFVIAGKGECEQLLRDQIGRAGLATRIHLIGNTHHPHNWMNEAEIFASTSRIEAFPMAICEAMMSGLPIVAVEYNSSAQELIPVEAGYVIKPEHSVSGVYESLQRLMMDQEVRERMGRSAKEEVACYDVQAVVAQWFELFSSLGCKQFDGGGR